MRKLTYLFVMAMLVSGCEGLGTRINNYYTGMGNTNRAIQERPNLQGYTQEQILSTYGQPTSTSTSYIGNNIRSDMWSYSRRNMYGSEVSGGDMTIIFWNGVVNSVIYN